MAPPIGRIYDLAAHLLDCVRTQLGVEAPSLACVRPGNVTAWDNCCGDSGAEVGGQLSVNVARVYPSRQFPDLDQGRPTTNCIAPYMVVQYNIEILRCTPVVNDRGEAPSCTDLDANAELALRDLEQVRLGAACCLLDEDALTQLVGQPTTWIFGDSVTLGPKGGCVGSQLTIFVGIPPCYNC